MGFKLPKIKAPKLPAIKAPQIKLDPTKLVTKATEGLTNVAMAPTMAGIDGLTKVGGAALGGVGKLMSDPAAGAVLGAAGMAFGVPGLGGLAAGFAKKPEAEYSISQAPASASPIVIQSGPSSGSGVSTNMMLMIGGGLVALVLIILMIKKK